MVRSPRYGWWDRGVDVGPGPQHLLAVARGRLAVDLGDVLVAKNATTDVAAHLPKPAEIRVVVRRGTRVVGGASMTLDLPDAPASILAVRDLVPGHWSLDRVEHVAGPGMDLATTADDLGRAWFRRLPPGRARLSVVDPATQ